MHASGAKLLCPAGFYYFYYHYFIISISAVLLFFNILQMAQLTAFPPSLST